MDFPTNTLKQNRAFFSLLLSLSFLFLITFYFTSIFPSSNHPKIILPLNPAENCAAIEQFPDRTSRCDFVRSNYAACRGKAYLNYLDVFYCGARPPLGYAVLVLWLVVLFYVLGDTASTYFCPSVAGLSRALRLSPALAGTTLLPLGNGANDVFAAVVSFARSGGGGGGSAAVGLNGVLGGALFITCFVVGLVSFVARARVVERAGFIRDVLFLLFSLGCLLAILAFGRVGLWAALGFVSIYAAYIVTVFGMQLRRGGGGEIEAPLLDEEKGLVVSEKCGLVEVDRSGAKLSRNYYYLDMAVYLVDLPLSLPRKLTIPVVSEESWSKPRATCSAALAPVFCAAVCVNLAEITDFRIRSAVYLSSATLGFVLGLSAFVLTKKSSPPKRLMVMWLVGGFAMSITWTYVVVEEVVSLLIAFGHILGISTSVLGVTVLAWGNSLGDLISNTALALRGGTDGAQVALSGCYAGPLFNTLIGLGFSLVFAVWGEYPSSYEVPGDGELYETVGFLMGGLLWALVILPKRDMRLDKSLGVGLLAIYFCFLFLRLVNGVGLLKLGT
ncbi:sodium/calcium exchanger family protein [Striga asiatica]|uniref:Sodium/calcium exchanger family protein n=1 Tax=Striga asiatica TaxID=4170 RepID=A0A5A7R3Q9_STRAF|nr:sodium/calcium exchanger family protein [Striga asiatica]